MIELGIGVVLGALASWYITHRYYAKASADQRAELSALTEKLKHRNTLVDFEQHLHSGEWDKEQISSKEVWVCRANNTFQVTLGESISGFGEPWALKFPNKSASTCPVYLRNGNAVIKELLFVYVDEFRIFVPMPEVRMSEGTDAKYEYYWSKSSLEYLVCQIVGSYYIHRNLEGVAAMAGVLLED